MNKKVLFFCTLTIFIASIACLFLFRIIPSSKTWENYTVLFVEKNIPIDTITSLLEKQGINTIISPNHENYPIASKFAPVQFHTFADGINYQKLQTAYFSDENNNYNLFYIPDEYSTLIPQSFNDTNIIWGINNNTTITIFPFIITMALLLLLIIFAKNKVYFLCTQLPFTVLTFIIPLYQIAVCVCALLFSFFIVEKYKDRIGYSLKIIKNYNLYVFLGITFVIMILLGIQAVALFLLAGTACVAIHILYSLIINDYKNKQIFLPTPIHSANTLSLNAKTRRLTILITFSTIALLTTFALWNPQTGNSNSNDIKIPTPQTEIQNFSEQSYLTTITNSNKEVNRLPNLTDYISVAWYYEMYPYMRVDNTIKNIVYPGDTIVTTEYIKTNDKIEEKTKTQAKFNNDYIEKTLATINSLENPGAEKLLASQKGFARVCYASNKTVQLPTDSFIIMFCIAAYFLIVFLYLKIKRI